MSYLAMTSEIEVGRNLGRRGADLLREAGHDVCTAAEEGLLSTPDSQILERCRLEERALVSLDRGLADPAMHDPADHAGIIVLRLPRKPKRIHFNKAIKLLIAGFGGIEWTVACGWFARPRYVYSGQEQQMD
jgi:hypothetical protein